MISMNNNAIEKENKKKEDHEIVMCVFLILINTSGVVGSTGVTSNASICDHITEFNSVIYNTTIDQDLAGVVFCVNWSHIESNLALKLVMPNGTKIDQNVTSSTILHEKDRDNRYECYFVPNPPKGTWSIEISSLFVPNEGEDYCMRLVYINWPVLGDAKLNNLIEYSAMDRDFNGLVDQINVDVGVTVNVSGEYIVNGTLYYDKIAGSLTASNISYLTFGMKFPTLHFTGMHAPGPYKLRNITLYDGLSKKFLDCSREEHQILIYKNIDINFPNAKLTQYYLDHCENVTGNGKKTVLTIDVGINVIVPGNYTLLGSLYDRNGSEVGWSVDNGIFDIGYHLMHLNFNGSVIEKQKLNGPYKLSDLTLSSRNWTFMDAAIDAYTTKFYNYSDFG